MIRLEKAGADAADLILPVMDEGGIAQTGSLPVNPDIAAINTWLDTDNRRRDTRLVIGQETGAVIGFGGLWNGAPVVNLGYFINRSFAGRGIATQTAGLLLKEALSRPEILRITAAAFQSNPASRRVLEKAGFVLTGEFTADLPARGGERAHWSFAFPIGDSDIQLLAAGPDAASLLLPALSRKGLQQMGSMPLVPDLETLQAWMDEDNRRAGIRLINHIPTDRIIGYVGVWPGAQNTASMAYYVDEQYAGQGIATRAARLFLQDIVTDQAVSCIRTCAFHSNPASRRVLQKLGFQFEKDFVSTHPVSGAAKNAWLFALEL